MVLRISFVGNKLKEASQQQQFNRNIEDIEVWLGEIEGQLMSEDYGKVSTCLCSVALEFNVVKYLVKVHCISPQQVI